MVAAVPGLMSALDAGNCVETDAFKEAKARKEAKQVCCSFEIVLGWIMATELKYEVLLPVYLVIRQRGELARLASNQQQAASSKKQASPSKHWENETPRWGSVALQMGVRPGNNHLRGPPSP